MWYASLFPHNLPVSIELYDFFLNAPSPLAVYASLKWYSRRVSIQKSEKASKMFVVLIKVDLSVFFFTFRKYNSSKRHGNTPNLPIE